MLLSKSDGSPFASGVSQYIYGAARPHDPSSRIKVMVLFEDQQVMAVLDTGAPYSICTPQIADIIGLKRELNDVDIRLIVAHLGEVRGYLKRMTVRFLAYEGESLDIDATAFVPDLSPEDWDSTFPSFIGLTNCLELVRFAVDPANNTFYFGATDGGI